MYKFDHQSHHQSHDSHLYAMNQDLVEAQWVFQSASGRRCFILAEHFNYLNSMSRVSAGFEIRYMH